MIIARAPVRLSLGGGGTDLPSYYSQNGGFVVSAALARYIYIVVHERYEKGILLKYFKNQLIDDCDYNKVDHPLIREVLRYFDIRDNLDIASFSDVPPNCGLGTSGAFLVALITAIVCWKGLGFTKGEIAELACSIEIDILKRPVGKQDQYISSFGGLACMEISSAGVVQVQPLNITADVKGQLLANTLLYDTGIQRDAGTILEAQSQKAANREHATLHVLDEIKRIAHDIQECLLGGDLAGYGRLLHEHWSLKQKLSPKIASTRLNTIYTRTLVLGASGGKISGAGGGGFLTVYCPKNHEQIHRYLESEGFRRMRFEFDEGGGAIVHHGS